MDHIKEEAEKFSSLSYIEKQTGGQVKKEQVLIGIMVIIGLLTFTRAGCLVISIAGVIIPLRESLMVLNTVNPKINELKHLLVFWMIFSLMVIFESAFGFVIRYIPLYYLIKLVFLWYIGPLKFNGAYTIYELTLSKIPSECYMGGCKPVEAAKKIASQVEKKVENTMKNEEEMK
ncbi:YOP1 protein [Spraguea lophii 42_110]|uniref:Protein YOP1 n=1 Tax=Spraguea lophii (strain 42_110) TaxID=1358809 RepID=S7W8K1_SPRLO|nr:YOP1 protein [Spraguea lophii 42_110]